MLAPAHLPAAADQPPLGEPKPKGPVQAASLGPPRACSLEAAATLATLLPLPGEPQGGQAAAAPRQRSPRAQQQQQQPPARRPQQQPPAGPQPAAKRARTAAAAVPPPPAQQVPLSVAPPPQPAQPLLLPLPFSLLPAQQVPPLPGWQAALLASLGQAAQALAPRPPSIAPPSSPLAGRDAAAQLFHGGSSSSLEQMLHALGGSGSSAGNLSAGVFGGSGNLSPRGLGGGTAAGQGGGAADGDNTAAQPAWAAPTSGLAAALPPMPLSLTTAPGQPAGGSGELGSAAVQPGTPRGEADELQHQLLALLHSMAPSPSQLAQGQQQVVVQQLPTLQQLQAQAPDTPHMPPKTAEVPLPPLILPSLPPLAAPSAAAAAGAVPAPFRAPTPLPPVSPMATALAAAAAAAAGSAAGAGGGLPSPRAALTQALLGALPALGAAGDGKAEAAGAAPAGTAAAGPAAGPVAGPSAPPAMLPPAPHSPALGCF